MKKIDARGRACPEPVMMTMKGIKENPDGVEVLVDNECAAENVTRFAISHKYQVKRQNGDGEYSLSLTKQMNRYIAIFHTHLSAMRTYRSLAAAGYDARMAPVPRVLSSSCGTCVYYCGEDEAPGYMDADYDYIVRVLEDGRYEPVNKAE